MDRKDKAVALHNQGFNCAQSVLLAFADDIDMDREQAFRISEGFGFGMGFGVSTCGALSGAMMLAGLANSDGNMEQPGSKRSTYQLDKQMHEMFVETAGSYICRELKGKGTGSPLYSCEDCIRLGVEVAEKALADKLD